MTDLCAKGGLDAKSNYYRSDNPYTLVEKHLNECIWSDISSKECYDKEKEEYCNGGYQDYIDFLKKIITDCPTHANEIETSYYEQRLEMIYKCSKDSVTGEVCEDVLMIGFSDGIPSLKGQYRKWEPYQCEISKSCLAEIDAVYREYNKSPGCVHASSPNTCEYFGDNNPLESCGKPYYEVSSTTGKSSSDATATALINSQIMLFSFIVCLIFALFK